LPHDVLSCPRMLALAQHGTDMIAVGF